MTTPGPMGQPELVLALAREALAAEPAGLLTDLDGTLAPIVADPAAVRLVPGAAELLASLGRRMLVAVVSGRAAADVRRVIGSGEVLVVGNHGLEWLPPGANLPAPAPGLEDAMQSVRRAVDLVPDLPGVHAENKGLSATVHVRGAPDPVAALDSVRNALEAGLPDDIMLRPGRMSIEVRPVGAGDKGTAVRELVERHGLRGLLVMGDDVTDLDMFRAAAALRSEGRLRAAILAVAGGHEVPAEVRDAADAVLQDPAAVVELLQAL